MSAREKSAPLDSKAVARHVKTLAEGGPLLRPDDPWDWNQLKNKRDATAALQAEGFSADAIGEMVGALCDARKAAT